MRESHHRTGGAGGGDGSGDGGGSEAYDLHARALESGEGLSEEDLTELVGRLPETDADDFVEEFAALQVTEAAPGGGGGDASDSDAPLPTGACGDSPARCQSVR